MKRLLVIFAIFFVPLRSVAQTGLPPFGSLDRIGLEVRNNQDLNVLLAIPIVSSPGRGLPLNFSVIYNSSIWKNTGTAWTPNTNNAAWGWTTVYSTGTANYKTTTSQRRCNNCPIGDGCLYIDTTTQNNYTYTDPVGTVHSFSGVSWSDVYNECTQVETISGTFTGYASDGSGYYLTIDSVDGSITSVRSRGGLTVYPGLTDTNGNYISASTPLQGETDWTDSAGRVALKVIAGTSSIQYKVPDSTGAYQTTTLNLQTLNVKTHFGCASISEYTGTASVPLSLVLPNNQQYSFTYESYVQNSTTYYTGRLQKVTLPTGGYHEYDYTGSNDGVNCADGTTLSMNKVVGDGLGNAATWNYVRNTSNLTTTITTPKLVDTPNASDMVVTFNSSGQEISRKFYKESPGVNVLRTMNITWAANGTPATGITILEDGTTKSEVDTTFESNGLLDSVTEYDWGTGTHGSANPLRTTSLTYQTSTNYTNLNILDLVTSKRITVSGTVQYRQDTAYDGVALQNTNCPTGAPQHNDGGYPCTFNYRGNPTQVTTYLTPGTPANGLITNLTYDWFGHALIVTDPQNNSTSVAYSDSWVNTSCQPASNTYAHATSVTNALSQVTSYKYYACSGLAGSVTDANNQTATASYDLLSRLSSATDPANATINFTYGGSTSAEYALNFNSGNSTVDALQTLDTLGRTQVLQRRQAPGSSNFDSVETDYDFADRPYRVTIPYSATAGQTSSSAPATTTSYDVLGRVSSVTDGANGTVTRTYSKNDVLVAVGPSPPGENLKQRQFEYDALGRLTSVCEVTAGTSPWPSASCGQNTVATGYLTVYTWNVLGDLIYVTQNFQSTGNHQTRSYSFDAARRLTSETNPESSTTTYTWDTDTTCGTSKGDIVKKVDAAGNVTCTAYDALHRPTSITYPSGPNSSSTAMKVFYYDTSHFNTTSNTKGRLASAGTCQNPTCAGPWITAEDFSYSARGELTDVYEWTTNSGGWYHVTQTYWPHGAADQLSGLTGLPTITYGGTIGSTVGLDGEGRVTQVTATVGQNPVTAVSYNTAGLPTLVNLGSGDSDIFAYDANTMRMSQYQFKINGQSVTSTLAWNANGTLGQLAITDPFSAVNTQTCNYQHDDLVRISQVDCGTGGWGQGFGYVSGQNQGYDPFGNLTKSVLSNHSGNSFQPTYNAATNRFASIPGCSTLSYDNDGNVLNDCVHTYAWDASGDPTTVDSVSSTFDAFNRMVEQNRSGAYTQIVYSPSGAKLALMNGQTLQKAYVRLPGTATAVYTATAPLDHYQHADWLGSSRLGSQPYPAVPWSETAYAPFGEPYAQSGASDLSFTGMNSDTTSGDYDFLFREYSNQGRWASPDPAGLASVDPSNPQSWNRYTYTKNRPTSLIDPSGLCDVIVGGFEQTPGTPETETQQSIAADIGADQAYPYSGLNFGESVSAAYGTVAPTVAADAIVDAAFQSNGQPFTVYAFSGGAQAVASAWPSLPQSVQSQARVFYISPGRVPFGQSLPPGQIVQGQGPVDSFLTGLSPNGSSIQCGHSANCEFGALSDIIENVRLPQPCKTPDVFTRDNIAGGTGGGGGGGSGGGGASGDYPANNPFGGVDQGPGTLVCSRVGRGPYHCSYK